MLFEQIHYRSRVANIQVVMFIVAKVRDQVVARFFRGSFGAKKLCAHVVVDPKNTRAVSRETPHAFRANQSRRTCNDDRAHESVWHSRPSSVAGARLACRTVEREARCLSAPRPGWLCYDSQTIHVTSPADGFTRRAGNCRSPARTRSISWGLFDAPTRNKM